MRGWASSEAGDGIDGGSGAGVDEDAVGAQGARASGAEVDLDGVGVEQASEAHDDFGAALFEVVEMHLVEAVNHFSLASSDGGHVDVPFAVVDAELGAALKVRGYLGAVDDVLGWKTGDVGAGSADGVLFDGGDTLALRAEMPGHEFACFSRADDDGVVLLRGGQRRPP